MKTEVLVAIITGSTTLLGVIAVAWLNFKTKKYEIDSKKEQETTEKKYKRQKTKNKYSFGTVIFALLFLASLLYIFISQQSQEETINSFSGEMRFELQNGKEMPAKFTNLRGIEVVEIAEKGNYKLTEAYQSGTQFRLLLKNKQSAYLYAIACNEIMGISILYPFNLTDKTFFENTEKEISIPNTNNALQLDNNKGIDIFCLLYSSKEININKLKTQLEKAKEKTFTERLYNILSDKIVTKNEINYKINNIIFESKSKKTILPIIVTINHN